MKSRTLRWLLVSFFLAVPLARAEAAREVKIIAAVSPAFKADDEWRKDIIGRVGYANKVFERTFGIHFSIEKYVTWEPPDESKGMPLLVEDLKKFTKPSADHVVIGFHKMSKALDKDVMEDMETVGTASFFEGRIAIRDPFGSQLVASQYQTILTHELAHLFGAVHIGASSAIMYPSLPQVPDEQIDPENSRIIQQTKTVDFLKGLDSLSPQTVDNLIAVYEKLIRANPQSDFYHQLGLFYRKRNLEARAIAIWEEALRYKYANPAIHYELGIYYHKAGQYDRAVQELGAAIAHFVLDSQKVYKANTLNILGAAYFEKDHVDQAVFTWMQGLVLDPDNPGLQSNLAAAFLKKGDIERASAELEKMHAKNPEDVVVLSNLGTLNMQKKDYVKAVEYFTKALEKSSAPQKDEPQRLLNPIPEWELRLDLGAAYAEMKDLTKAVQQLERAKAGKPGSPELRRELGRVYVLQKEFRKAITELDEAVKLKPKDAGTYALLAQAQAESGNAVQALAAAKEAIRYSDDKDFQASLHRNMGLIYAKDNNLIKALEELKIATSLNWNDPDAHYNLGVTYVHQQDWENAKRSFKTALSLKPGFTMAREALDNLEKARK